MSAKFHCEDSDAIAVANTQVSNSFMELLTQYKGLLSTMKNNEPSLGTGVKGAITVVEQMYAAADKAQEELVALCLAIENMNRDMEELDQRKIDLN